MTDLRVKCYLSIKAHRLRHLKICHQQEALTEVEEGVMDQTMVTILAVIISAVM